MAPVNLNIYKHIPYVRMGYDPTNGGISSRLDEFYVFPAEATDDEVREWCEKRGVKIEDVARLNKRMLWGEKHYYIEPVVQPEDKIGPMFGGNYAATSNGIFARLLGETTTRVLPIFDRFETEEEYEMLSR